MMSESVTVTVQGGQEANRGAGGPAPAPFRLNVEYFSTPPGIIKIIQIILGILCMALGFPSPNAAGAWFSFVAVVAFIVTVLWSAIYLTSIKETMLLKIPVNWLLSELINTGLFTVLYFTAFICELVSAFHRFSYILAGIFGLFNTLAYAAGTYYLYMEHVGSQR